MVPKIIGNVKEEIKESIPITKSKEDDNTTNMQSLSKVESYSGYEI